MLTTESFLPAEKIVFERALQHCKKANVEDFDQTFDDPSYQPDFSAIHAASEAFEQDAISLQHLLSTRGLQRTVEEIMDLVLETAERDRTDAIFDDVIGSTPDDLIIDNGMTGKEFKAWSRKAWDTL